MRILHVVPTYLPATRYGGPIYSVHGLCKSLAGLGHEVHVFTTNVDGNTNSKVPLGVPVELDGVKVWYFSSNIGRRLYWSPTMFQALKEQIRDFEIVHLHSVFLWPTWAAARLARRYSIPYVLSPRGMLVKALISSKSRWLKSAWIHLIERRNIEKAAMVHLTAEIEKEAFEEFGFGQVNLCVIPNGVEQSADLNQQSTSDDVRQAIALQPYVLYLGRLNWKKGLDRLIKAMTEVERGYLVIAGNDEEGYVSTIRALVNKHGLTDRIHIVDRFISGGDKAALYSNARVFVLPSYSENFGNTVTEAMARSCPVIVTKEVGAAEVVAEADAGIVCEGNELAASINRLVQNEKIARHRGLQGRVWVEQYLVWSAIAERICTVYSTLLPDVNKASLP